MIKEEAIEILSDMRAEYNIFSDNEEEATRYHALSWAIQALNERTGRWMFTDAAPHRVYCSECYKTFIPNKEWYAWAEHIVPRKYCPNCGCAMKEGDAE